MMKTLHKCIVCGAELSAPIFKIKDMPAGAQALPDAAGLSADKGMELALSCCPGCGLVQLDCEPVVYFRDAIRVVGLSETMKRLRRDDVRLIREKYGKSGGKHIECGCGNGDFLKIIAEESGAECYGTEAGNANIAAAGKLLGEDAKIIKFFPETADMDIPGAPFDVFYSFNFLEHQPDPVAMLKCLHKNLADDGVGLITVPSFEYIVGHGGYYELVRDHIANFDKTALTNLCVLSGFKVLELDYIGIGDTLRAVVKKAFAQAGENVPVPSEKVSVSGGTGELALRLKESYEGMTAAMAGYMGDLQRKGESIALWGAGHQGITIAATTALRDHAKYIIDSSPLKQGRFAPSSHIPIVSPEHYIDNPVDVIMIAAPGYVDEIRQVINKLYDRPGISMPGVVSVLDFVG